MNRSLQYLALFSSEAMITIFLSEIIAAEIDLTKPQYIEVTLDSNTELKLNNSNVAFMLFNKKKEVSIDMKISSKTESSSFTAFQNESIFIQGDSVKISFQDASTIDASIWIVKNSICPLSGYLFYNQESIHFNLAVKKPYTPFCIFGYPKEETTTQIKMIPYSSTYGVEIYQSSSLLEGAGPKNCGVACELIQNKPFFIRVNPQKDKHTELTIDYHGKMKELTETSCTVKPVGYILPGSEAIQLKYANGEPGNILCGHEAESNNNPLIIIIVCFALSGIIAAICYIIVVSKVFRKKKEDEGYLIERIDEDEKDIADIVENAKASQQPVTLADIPKFL